MTHSPWVKGYSANNSTGKVEQLTSDDLKETSAKYYWVENGAGKVVQFATYVKGITVSGKTTYDVAKPTVTVTVPRRNLPYIDSVRNGVGLGSPASVASVGIAFRAVTSWAGTGTTGTTQFVQLASPSRYYSEPGTLWGINHYRWQDPLCLDTGYPYFAGATGGNTTTNTDDSPFHPFSADMLTLDIRNENFEMYVMVKPNYADAIYVPTHMVSWSWSIYTTKIASTGAWGHGAVSLPSYNGPTSTSKFPEWTKNAMPPKFVSYTP